MTRCPRSARLSGALAITLLLVASFAVRLHEAVVPHGICPEHGEAVELSSAHVPLPSDTGGHELRLVDVGGRDQKGHDHCDLALLGRTKELLDTRLVLAPFAVSEHREPIPTVATRAARSVPLLLQAPKHSPPAVV